MKPSSIRGSLSLSRSQKLKLDVKSNLEDSGLLGYDALLLGECFLTVQRYFAVAATRNTRLPTRRHIPEPLNPRQNSIEIYNFPHKAPLPETEGMQRDHAASLK